AFVQGPSSATAGVAISPAVTVNVLDAFSNNVPGASVTIAILNNAGLGTLSGTALAATDATGVAAFSDLSINKAATGYTLQATTAVNSITTLSSGSFDITAAAAKSLTVAVANPVGKALASDVTVTALDVFGNVATGYAGTVSLTS